VCEPYAHPAGFNQTAHPDRVFRTELDERQVALW
jgi:hypothetical protein